MAKKQARKLLSREQLDEIAARDGFLVFLRSLGGLNYVFLYANTQDEKSPDRLNKTYDARDGKPYGKEYPPQNGHRRVFHSPISCLPATLSLTGFRQYTGRGNVNSHNKAMLRL